MEGYTILETIAETENSKIDLAYDIEKRRLCVIKKIKNGSADAYLPLIGIKHPNLCRVYRVLPNENAVVTEYVEGRVLSAERPMPESEVRMIGISLFSALNELHKNNIIHKDIKPSNIMLTNDGTVKIIDYGISRTFKPGMTSDTVNFGTRGYAPPEQFGFAQTDFRSDIYAAGVVMHDLATGGKTIDRLSEYSGSLKPVIQKCVSLDPAMRYSSAEDAKRALEGNSAESAVPPRKHKNVAIIALAVAAAVTLFACRAAIFGFLSTRDGVDDNLSSTADKTSDADGMDAAASAVQIDTSGYTDDTYPIGASSLRAEPYVYYSERCLEIFVKVKKNSFDIEKAKITLFFELLDDGGVALGTETISYTLVCGGFDVINKPFTSAKYKDGAFYVSGGKLAKIKLTSILEEPAQY